MTIDCESCCNGQLSKAAKSKYSTEAAAIGVPTGVADALLYVHLAVIYHSDKL